MAGQAPDREFFNDIDKFTELTNKFTDEVEALPAALRSESIATIDHLLRGFAAEREQTLLMISDESVELRALLNDVETAAIATTALSDSIDHLLSRFDIGTGTQAGKSTGGASGMEVFHDTIIEMRSTARELEGLVATIDDAASSPQWQEIQSGLQSSLGMAEHEAQRLANHVFLLLAGLIVLAVAGVVVVRLTPSR